VSGSATVFLPALQPGAAFLGALGIVVLMALLGHGIAVRRLGEMKLARVTLGIEGTLFCVFLAGMLGLSGLQIVLRNFFHGGVLWIDPLVRALVLWVAFFGALVATSHGRHLHIDVIRRLLSPKWGVPLDRVLAFLCAVCCALLANGAFMYLRDEYGHGASPFLGVPSWAVQSILLWGFVLLTYRFMVQVIWPTRVHPVSPSTEAGREDLSAGTE
jgi:TRAP-type C4-dicarboxylate transport system permease small subunit